MVLARCRGDEVTVLCREAELTPLKHAEENRQISGCRPGKDHLPVYCSLSSQTPRQNHAVTRGTALGVCGSAGQNAAYLAHDSTEKTCDTAFCVVYSRQITKSELLRREPTMCGIVGYIGARDATPIILGGLKRLEYRGYDSAGIAVIEGHAVGLRRDVGKLCNLERCVAEHPLTGRVGIGHTRWATHGQPCERNAHPHISMDGQYVVVHNGIVENYLELREDLRSRGVIFKSDTDTEVIVHLVADFAQRGEKLVDATRHACQLLRGAPSIVVISAAEPDQLIAVRIGNAGGVAIGLGNGEAFIASDIPAILDHTAHRASLETRRSATVTANGCLFQTLTGDWIDPQIHYIAC